MSADVNAVLLGLSTGLTLIVAIGSQNAFVLRQGLRRERVALVVAICLISDVVLICGGVAGIGSLLEHAPSAVTAVRWLGVAFLASYGALALWRARRTQELTAEPGTMTSARSVALVALALTWLNPHVYLDTVILLGSIANAHGPVDRWWFALGACLASSAWFIALGWGARLAAPVLRRPRSWQILETIIGLTMLALACRLAVS